MLILRLWLWVYYFPSVGINGFGSSCQHIAQETRQFWARNITSSCQHTTQEITLPFLSVAGWWKSKTVCQKWDQCVCLGHMQILCPSNICSLGQRWACVGSLTWCSWLRTGLPIVRCVGSLTWCSWLRTGLPIVRCVGSLTWCSWLRTGLPIVRCVGSLTWCSWLRTGLPDPTCSWHLQTLVPFWLLAQSFWLISWSSEERPVLSSSAWGGASCMSASGSYWCIGWKRSVHL